MPPRDQDSQKAAKGGDQVARSAPLSPDSISPESLELFIEGQLSMRTDLNNSVKSLPLIIVEDRARVTAVAHPRRGPDSRQKKWSNMVDIPVFLCDEEITPNLHLNESTTSLSLYDLYGVHHQEPRMAQSASALANDDASHRSKRKSTRRQSTEPGRKLRTLSEGEDSSAVPTIRRPSGDVRMLSSMSNLTVDESSVKSLRKKVERAAAQSPASSKKKKVSTDPNKKIIRSKSKQHLSTCEKTPGGSSSTKGKLSRANSMSSMSIEKKIPKKVKCDNKERGEGDTKEQRRNSLVELQRALSTSRISNLETSNTELENAATSSDDKSSKHSGRSMIGSFPRLIAERLTTKRDTELIVKTPKQKGRENLSRAASLPRQIAERLMRKETPESDKSHKREAVAVGHDLEKSRSMSKSASERILVKSDSKRKVVKSISRSTLQTETSAPTRSKSSRRLTSSFSDLKVGDLTKSPESTKHLSRDNSSRTLKKSKSKLILERHRSKSVDAHDTKTTSKEGVSQEKERSSSRGRRTAPSAISSPTKTGQDSAEKENSGRSQSRGRTHSSKSKHQVHDGVTIQSPKKKGIVDQNLSQRSCRLPPSKQPSNKSPPRPPQPSRTSTRDHGVSSSALRSTLRSQSPSARAVDRSRLVAHPCTSPGLSPKRAGSVRKASYLQLNLPQSYSSQGMSPIEKLSMSCSALDYGINDHRLLSTKLSYLELAEPRRNDMLYGVTQHSLAPSVSDTTLKMSNAAGANGCCKEESDSYSQSLSVESPAFGGGGAIAV